MVVDVVFAVTVVALAAGTVTEFQFGIADVSSAADGAAVGVDCSFGRFGGFSGTGVEGDDLCFFLLNRLLRKLPLGLDPPGKRQHIQHIFAEEQEVVGQGNHREQIVGEGIGN